MTRFALAVVIGSMRNLLAIIIAVLAIAGAAYLGTHEVGFPVHQAACYSGPRLSTPSCRQPTYAAWHMPLAIVLAALGLGAAAAVATERPWRHAHDRTPDSGTPVLTRV
jgi:hypothetical protein